MLTGWAGLNVGSSSQVRTKSPSSPHDDGVGLAVDVFAKLEAAVATKAAEMPVDNDMEVMPAG